MPAGREPRQLGRRHPEPPARDQTRAPCRRIEFRRAARQAPAARREEVLPPGQAFGEKAETLEHGAVAELVGDAHELIARRILALEIRGQAVRDMADAASSGQNRARAPHRAANRVSAPRK